MARYCKPLARMSLAWEADGKKADDRCHYYIHTIAMSGLAPHQESR